MCIIPIREPSVVQKYSQGLGGCAPNHWYVNYSHKIFTPVYRVRGRHFKSYYSVSIYVYYRLKAVTEKGT